MDVVYCDNCASRINPGDFADRLAVRGDDGKAYCAKCAPLYEQTSSALLKVVLPVASAAIDDSPTALALPAAMMPEKAATKFFFCETCGKRITATDIEKGAGRDKKLKGVYCKDCAQGVATMEFEALKAPPFDPVARAQPASPVPSRPQSLAPESSVEHARNKPGAAAPRRKSSSPAIPWTVGIAGAAAIGLVLYVFLGRSHNVPMAPTSEKILAKSGAPAPPPAGSSATSTSSSSGPPAFGTVPHEPSKVTHEGTANPTGNGEPLTTIRIDFQKEPPWSGTEGFEAADNPPAGSTGHPMRLQLHPRSGNGGSSASVDVNAFLTNGTGPKGKVFATATATSVVHMRVYADNVTHFGAGVLELNPHKWHSFGNRIPFTKAQHVWTTVEIPLKDLKDDKGGVPAGLQITAFSVSAFGTKGYAMWIDDLAILPQPAAPDEKP